MQSALESNHGRSKSVDHVVYPPLDGKGSSYCNWLLFYKRLHRQECCSHCQSLLFYQGVSDFCSLPQLGPKSKGHWLLLQFLHMPSGVIKIPELNGKLAWEILRALICWTSILLSQRQLVVWLLSLIYKRYNGQRICAKWSINVHQYPKILTKGCTSFTLFGIG